MQYNEPLCYSCKYYVYGPKFVGDTGRCELCNKIDRDIFYKARSCRLYEQEFDYESDYDEFEYEKPVICSITVIKGSCVEQKADAIVNAANPDLLAGDGSCSAIFSKAGLFELTKACSQYETPIATGEVAVTPAFGIANAKAIIHAVGPDFRDTPNAFKDLYDAYYNSLLALYRIDGHSIAFPLISAGINRGNLEHPAAESTKQCMRAYHKFITLHPDYSVCVYICAFTDSEYYESDKEYNRYIEDNVKY